MWIRRTSREPASRLISAPACTAARTGRRSRSVPRTRMIYIPANNNQCSSLMGVPVQYVAGRGFGGVSGFGGSIAPGADHFGEVQAWNVDTGKQVWMHPYPKSPNWGAMLATAGGLVFTGGTADRRIHAFDASNGKLLWEYPTELGHRRAADVLRHRRQAVHRRARRLGRRPERNAGRAQPRVSRRVSAGAGRGRGVGVRARVTRSDTRRRR